MKVFFGTSRTFIQRGLPSWVTMTSAKKIEFCNELHTIFFAIPKTPYKYDLLSGTNVFQNISYVGVRALVLKMDTDSSNDIFSNIPRRALSKVLLSSKVL